MKIIYDTGYRDQIRFLNTASTLEKKQSLEFKLITDKGYLSYVWNKIFPIPIPIIEKYNNLMESLIQYVTST